MLGAAALVGALSCGGTTGGALIHVPFQVGGVQRDPSQPFVFTNPLGWTIELDDAAIALGPFYFNIAQPETASYHTGVFIVQVTSQVLVNPLDPTLYDVDGGADGETGTAVSAEIELYPPDGTGDPNLTNLLGNSQGFIQGTATKDDVAVHFAGYVQIDQALVTPPVPLVYLERVPGAECDLDFTAQPQVLQLRVDPTHWFDGEDFSSLVPPPPTSPDAGPPPDGGAAQCTAPDAGSLTDGGSPPDAGPPVCTPLPDAGAPDAGPADAGLESVNTPPWTDSSTFNLILVDGVQSRTSVYLFSLTSP